MPACVRAVSIIAAALAAADRLTRAAVVRALGADPEAAHRRHALLVAGVVAGLGPAGALVARVDAAPRIVVGRLGAGRRGGEQDGGDERSLEQAHGSVSFAVSPAIMNTRRLPKIQTNCGYPSISRRSVPSRLSSHQPYWCGHSA